MRAMVLRGPGQPLALEDWPIPQPGPGQVLVKVESCGICRTDLHVVDGDLPYPKKPVIPGHEIVGRIVEVGPGVSELTPDQRVGVPWLASTCGRCDYCLRGQENLCDHAQFTGYTVPGGYAEYTVADARYAFRLTAEDPLAAAPLLCAGLIGYRALKMAGQGQRIGLYGFGASAHILAQVLVHQKRDVYAFTRPEDVASQDFARRLGAVWAGGSDEMPPHPLDAAIIFAPVGSLVPQALKATDKGGTVVAAGIHMSEIPSFAYSLLWQERTLRSVANLTRADGMEFLPLSATVPISTRVTAFALEDANHALGLLRRGEVQGALVLVP